MRIVVPEHAEAQARERGVTVEEIVQAVEQGTRFPAHSGRIGAALVLPFGRIWGRKGRTYDQKRVVVYFVEFEESVTVVTVISQYGRWEA